MVRLCLERMGRAAEQQRRPLPNPQPWAVVGVDLGYTQGGILRF
jgi:hypothetical protein